MEQRNLKEWEKGITVLFGSFPQLKSLISNPVYYSNAPWAGEVNNYFLRSTEGTASENFYRVVFKKGSPKNLMTIGSGELSGLKTTTVVEKGRIAETAGLERVDVPAANNLLPMLLTTAMFGAIQNRLSYISNVCADIRNRQIVGDHAKLERISEVILDCFESIPEMDQDVMRLNLARMVTNTDECLEILFVMKDELTKLSKSKNTPHSTTNWGDVEITLENYQKSSYRPVEFLHEMMRHSVFAAYERFVAGKICQIVLSGNYSPSNIERSKKSVSRACESIRQIFNQRIQAHKNGIDGFKRRISELEDSFRKGYEIEKFGRGDNIRDLEFSIEAQTKTITEIEQHLYDLLDSKLESFDFLLQLANQDEIDVYLVNGALVIEKNEISEQVGEQRISRDELMHLANLNEKNFDTNLPSAPKKTSW